MSVATRGEYKGYPTITLAEKPGSKYGFSFGLGKARLILAHIEDVKAFVADADIKAAAKEQLESAAADQVAAEQAA